MLLLLKFTVRKIGFKILIPRKIIQMHPPFKRSNQDVSINYLDDEEIMLELHYYDLPLARAA